MCRQLTFLGGGTRLHVALPGRRVQKDWVDPLRPVARLRPAPRDRRHRPRGAPGLRRPPVSLLPACQVAWPRRCGAGRSWQTDVRALGSAVLDRTGGQFLSDCADKAVGPGGGRRLPRPLGAWASPGCANSGAHIQPSIQQAINHMRAAYESVQRTISSIRKLSMNVNHARPGRFIATRNGPFWLQRVSIGMALGRALGIGHADLRRYIYLRPQGARCADHAQDRPHGPCLEVVA